MTVICTNEECSEYQVSKVSLGGATFDVDEIVCGKCGGPVEEVTEDG
jgi:hypothetical protein